MILNETYTLPNGVEIPKIGLGTWRIDDNKVAQAIREAAKLGYRHFDTAQGYGNENGVGEGIRTCGVAREELFVTTKVDAAHKTYDSTKASIEESLSKLGLEYVDLMIIHSPQPWTEFREGGHFFEGNLEAWRALEDAHRAGKIRAIGVSNFEQVDLDNILKNGEVVPVVNQILAHVSNTPFELIDYCQDRKILVEAYSPIGHGALLENNTLVSIAAKYEVSVAQLSIRYCLQLGLLPLPKTANPKHMSNNANVDFTIDATDMEALKQIEQISSYGDAGIFPVFGGKLNTDGTLVARS